MLRSLRTAALGMAAQQLKVDEIANNLANANTTGFKKARVAFQDLLYETVQTGEADGRQQHGKPATLQVGLGNQAVATFRTFSQGPLEETNNPLDMGIHGRGFFQVTRPDGSIAYTRDGSFQVDAEGNLVNSSGLRLYPDITIPEGTNSINISEDGVVSVTIDGQESPEEIGRIELASFMNPAGLKAIGGNLFVQTESSGEPIFGHPGEPGFGTVHQGYLEKSNVDIVREMIDLIVAQRTYEINSKAVRTADNLLAIANNLKR